ncbi:hypothetical protein KY334_06375, partial [Candidatus Woesearchaeota archaeon]|nr:hypothetical protein [Candidatus Woesearchaeota archaeon]
KSPEDTSDKDEEKEEEIITEGKSIPKKIIYGTSLGILAIIISALVAHKGKAIMASHFYAAGMIKRRKTKNIIEPKGYMNKYSNKFRVIDNKISKIDRDFDKVDDLIDKFKKL